jgi:hypothetical protein
MFSNRFPHAASGKRIVEFVPRSILQMMGVEYPILRSKTERYEVTIDKHNRCLHTGSNITARPLIVLNHVTE